MYNPTVVTHNLSISTVKIKQQSNEMATIKELASLIFDSNTEK